MARCALILPRLPQRMGAPYLGMQLVAASLLRAGHEVRCFDLAAVRARDDDDSAIEAIGRYSPALVGMTLFTYNALAGYQLLDALRSRRGASFFALAGGPHVTVRAEEAIAHGFDAAVIGEGELAAVAVAGALDLASPRQTNVAGLAGVLTRDTRTPGGFIADLDALPLAIEGLPAVDPEVYGGGSWSVPGGTVTSRGCPARCTFCANYVTGRGFRYRSAENVVAELRHLRVRHDVRHFAFWDDAFTANKPRLRALCDAIDREDALAGTTWSCITPANMVRPPLLERMWESGCTAINFGIESGDADVLRTIQKGQRPEQVIDAVQAASALGMRTVVNFMFGFPGEGPEAIGRTVELMRRISSSTDFFNNRGVLVPFPGTPVYEQHHERYGFSDWWLDPAYLSAEPDLFALDPVASQRYLRADPALDLDFFRYDAATRAAIAAAVAFKADHNTATLVKMGAAPAPASDERDLLAIG